MYIDDGETFDYQTGKYLHAELYYKDGVLQGTVVNRWEVHNIIESVKIYGENGVKKYKHLNTTIYNSFIMSFKDHNLD